MKRRANKCKLIKETKQSKAKVKQKNKEIKINIKNLELYDEDKETLSMTKKMQ